MTVDLIRYTALPEQLCGHAAAMCTNAQDELRALRVARRSGHESILEHVSFTFEMSGVSRALLAQITRHRIASFSVQSQRYVDMGEMPVVKPQTIQEDEELSEDYDLLMQAIRDFYNRAVERGIPKEDARYITPQAACTSFIVTMNARELRHFFALRCCNRAQWEIRELADQMLALCKKAAPKLFDDAGPGCVRGTCPEGKMTCGHPKQGVQNG